MGFWRHEDGAATGRGILALSLLAIVLGSVVGFVQSDAFELRPTIHD